MLLGQAAFRAARGLAEEGFVADAVVFHAGFGPGLYLKDAFPRAGAVGWFEWFYEAHGTDADFLDPAAIGPDDELRIRTLNAGMLVELAACDRAVTPTEWQRGRFPEPFPGQARDTARRHRQPLLRARAGPRRPLSAYRRTPRS